MEFSHSGPVLYSWAWFTPKSSKFDQREQEHAVLCVHLKLWSWTRFLFTCMLEHSSSAPHSYHAQARMTCVRHDRAKNKEMCQQTLTFAPKHGCTQQVL